MAVVVKAGTRQKKVSKHVMENSVEKVKSYLEDTAIFAMVCSIASYSYGYCRAFRERCCG